MEEVVVTSTEGVGISVDAPSNSNRKKVDRVTTTQVKLKKGSLAKRIMSEFITCDLSTVVDTAITDIIIPYAKDALLDCLHDGVDMIFGGGQTKRSYRKPTYVDYSSYSEKRSARRDQRRERVQGHNFKEIVLSTRAEAENVIESMIDILENEGSVSVADLYSLVGIRSAYTDETYGWTNLKSAIPQRVRDGYILSLPKPILL